MRLKREETIVAIGVESPQKIGPAPLAFACWCQYAICAYIFDMDIYEPGIEKVVRIGAGNLGTLQEVCRIEDGSQVRIVDRLKQIDTVIDRIAVDALLVLVKQNEYFLCAILLSAHPGWPRSHRRMQRVESSLLIAF